MFEKLRERIRGWFVDSVSWLSLGQQAYAIYKLAKDYPGVLDEAALKKWLLSACSASGKLADLTETEVDDEVIETAQKVIEDAEGWSFVYSLIIRAGSLKDIPEKWNEPESAATIIAAIGLLVQLIAKIREKRNNLELGDCVTVAKRAELLTTAPKNRSLSEQSVSETQKNAKALYKRLFGKEMNSHDVFGYDRVNPLNKACHDFILATILFAQSQSGEPIIYGNTIEEHDDNLRLRVEKIADAKYQLIYDLTKDIMQTE